MENNKTLLFLGGLGAPVAVFIPWFKVLKWHGYKIHIVPNSFFGTDNVSKFAQSLINFSSQFEKFDIIGISYGGNAALYGAYLNPMLQEKIRKMIVVCSPILGVPALIKPLRMLIPRPFAKKFNELAMDGEITDCIKSLDEEGSIHFDLHCFYHERDKIAPFKVATLSNVGTNHRLDFDSSIIPSMFMHQALYINPKTLKKVFSVLMAPQV